MSGNINYTKLIEDYFDRSISASDKAKLEHQLEVDPDLKSEFGLQNTIIETIRDARSAELKSRLNNIHIGWHHMIPNSWKVAAGVTLFTVTSLSAYFLVNDSFLPETKTLITTNSTEIERIEQTEESIPDIPEINISEENVKEESPITEKLVIEQPRILEIKEEESAPEREVVVVLPDLPDDFDEISNPDPSPIMNEEIVVFEPSGRSTSELNISSIQNEKYTFHYKFSEGNLALYGNFGDQPYEIMELNSSNGIKMFLFYKNNYYKLSRNTTKITPLETVDDTTLITELDVLRLNK